MPYRHFPMSAAVSSLERKMNMAVVWLPMVHGVEYLREGYFGSTMTAHYDLAYMAICNIGLTVFGLAQLGKVSRTVIPE